MVIASVLAASLFAVPCSGPGPGCTIEARINGRSTSLIVDTGADLTVLTARGAQSVGIRTDRTSPYIIVQGVAGSAVARLARARLQVGAHTEEDVLIAVMDDLDLRGRAIGLLGMTFLERFRTRMGRTLELEPIDAHDRERKGGRGRSWWSLRFREVNARLDGYRSLLARAQAADREIAASIGTSASGDSLEDMIRRLTEFAEASATALRLKAARAAVPLDWRR